MGAKILRSPEGDSAWGLVRRQHGVASRAQLLDLGLGPDAIRSRIETGRLHPIWRGVYAVGRPQVTLAGRWMGAVLACGPNALLSHTSAAALWGLAPAEAEGEIHVVVAEGVFRSHPGIRLHRRTDLGPEHRVRFDGIPVTDLVSTFVDLASCVAEWKVERAINEADRRDLIDPERLRAAVAPLRRRAGLPVLRRLVGCETLTEGGLERRFLALVRQAGLPEPETQVMVNGYRVDFYWPDLGLVAETDGWRYHRTPAKQAVDRCRDQAHTLAGLTILRFGEDQVRRRPAEVQTTLATVVAAQSRRSQDRRG